MVKIFDARQDRIKNFTKTSFKAPDRKKGPNTASVATGQT